MNRLLEVAAIAIGSFFAFAMEPLVGRALLSAFGGTAAVWVTCLAAFQVLLVVGYFYAHRLCDGGNFISRIKLHITLLVLAVVWCCLVALYGDSIKTVSSLSIAPALKTLIGVIIVSALPFVLLAANSSLIQVLSGGNYRLYAVSNIGSLLGLVAYPFLIEPFLSLPVQWFLIGSGIFVYAVLISVRILSGGIAPASKAAPSPNEKSSIPWREQWTWFGLSAAGVTVLNAVTAHMTGNVAPIPLLWAILLAVYLLTFVIGFSGIGEKTLPVWNVLALASVAAVIYVFRINDESQAIFLRNALAAGALLFFGGTAIHSHLYARRPSGAALTRYYLFLSLGGAVGGLLSGFAMPMISTWIVEYPIATAIVVLAVIAPGAPMPAWMRSLADELRPNAKKIRIGIAVVFGAAIWIVMCAQSSGTLAQGRSFYGTWKVMQRRHVNTLGKVFNTYEFLHAGTIHGIESVDPIYRDQPTAYFDKKAGGLAVLTHPEYEKRGLRVGVIGLGIGTLAWYAREQDTYDFFEICDEVVKVAVEGKWFDFMSKKKGKGSVIIGDARTELEKQREVNAPKYDVLIVDAYSGDSIPYHLVTKEAFHLYRDRLADGGTLVLQMTNWHIDLFPVAKAAAKELELNCSIIAGEGGNLTTSSNWALLSDNKLDIPSDVPYLDMSLVRDVKLPTDAEGSMIGFLKW